MPPIPQSAWSVLWKINQIAVPLLVAWGIWVSRNVVELQAWKGEGSRFTHTNGLELELRLRQEIQTVAAFSRVAEMKLTDKIATLPPQDWKDRIIAIEKITQENQKMLSRIEAKLENRP